MISQSYETPADAVHNQWKSAILPTGFSMHLDASLLSEKRIIHTHAAPLYSSGWYPERPSVHPFQTAVHNSHIILLSMYFSNF